MKKPVVTFVLEIYMNGANDYTLRNEFSSSQYGGEENAYLLARSVGEEYNKNGNDFVIYKETIEPVGYVLSEKTKRRLLNEK